MENKILELIHKYKQMKRTEPYDDYITIDFVIADLKSLIRMVQIGESENGK